MTFIKKICELYLEAKQERIEIAFENTLEVMIIDNVIPRNDKSGNFDVSIHYMPKYTTIPAPQDEVESVEKINNYTFLIKCKKETN